jgi:hypothetical protein
MSKTISQQVKEQRRTAQQPGAPEPHGQHDPRDVRTSLLSLALLEIATSRKQMMWPIRLCKKTEMLRTRAVFG